MSSAHADLPAAAEELPDADAALQMAADLSRRARREAETARRLAAVLADARLSAGAALSPPDHAPVDGLTIGCRSCSVTLAPTLTDPDLGAAQAREFFERHGDCLTFLDLAPIRRLLI